MGLLIGILKKKLKLLLYLAIICSAVLLIPNLPPYSKFTSLEYEPTRPRTGVLAPNDILNNPEKLYEGKLLGPEVYQVHNGEVYTGLATGEIVKVSPGGHVTFVTKIGKPCTGLVQEDICGRPLGLEIDSKNNLLYVADAYYGIWKVDLKTDKKEQLVSPNVEIDGRKPKLFNSVAVNDNGDVYWTDSSSDFHLKDGVYAMLMDPAGRLLYYNAAKKTNTVLLDNLAFANGVLLSLDKQFVLVAETAAFRIHKYYINGPKKGTSEVFAAGLPGTPDTIRALPDGSGVLASLYAVFDDEHPLLLKSMGPVPLVRKFLMRVALMIENSFDFINRQMPHPILEEAIYYLGHFKSIAKLTTGLTGLVQLDWNGNIVASYYNTDNKIDHVSDAIVYNDKLIMGCPHNQDFIAAVPAPALLKKAFATKSAEKVKAQEPPKVQKVQEQVKEKVQEKKEVPKQSKPVTQTPQESKKPVETPKPNPQVQKPAQPPVQQKTEQNAKPEIKETKKSSESADKKQEQAKPKTVAKEPEIKKEAVKPNTASPKPSDTKPKVAPKESDAKPKATPKESDAKPKVAPKESDAKPKAAPTPKGSDAKPKAAPKENNAIPKETKQAKSNEDVNKAKSKTQEAPKKVPVKNEIPKASKEEKKAPTVEIPVVEEIPSDTAKPSKEKLKVIKKSGPEVIPNPNL